MGKGLQRIFSYNKLMNNLTWIEKRLLQNRMHCRWRLANISMLAHETKFVTLLNQYINQKLLTFQSQFLACSLCLRLRKAKMEEAKIIYTFTHIDHHFRMVFTK